MRGETQQIATHPQPNVLAQFLELTKPRVNSLIVFTAIIGMMLAYPVGIAWDVPLMLTSTVGIALVAGAAAAFNCALLPMPRLLPVCCFRAIWLA